MLEFTHNTKRIEGYHNPVNPNQPSFANLAQPETLPMYMYKAYTSLGFLAGATFAETETESSACSINT